jgi:simple sugar transport system permease protein
MNVDLDLTPRQETSTWLLASTQLFTVVGALLVASIALVVVDINPLTAYSLMFIEPFTNTFHATRIINRSAPLILAGLAVYLPLRSGLYNIGAEGQLILGGIVTVWLGTSLPGMLGISGSGITIMLVSLLFGAVAGMVWVLAPVYLYVKYEVNEILTTLMLVFTAQRLSAYLINGPLQVSVGAFPRTSSVGFGVPTLFGTEVRAGIVIALLGVAGTWVLINKTRLGYEIVLSGSNEEVAVQTGINAAKVTVVVFMLAAAFAGLAGFLEIAGNQGNMTPGWNPGYGWTAIPIALLGRRGAIQTMLAGFLFSVLFVGGLAIETTLGVPAAISQIIESLIILFLITAEFIKSYRVDVEFGGRSAQRMIAGLFGLERGEGV